jgi:hypothetical protein
MVAVLRARGVNEPVPVAERYCRDQPLMVTGVVPALKSSTKSSLRVEPELPPAPYTWLMTMVFEMANENCVAARSRNRAESARRAR